MLHRRDMRFGSKFLFLCLVPHCGQAQVIILQEEPTTLLEALKSTLGKHPTIQFQQEQVQLNRGMLQQAAGRFDTVLNGTVQGNHYNTPLTKAQQAEAAAAGINTSNDATNLVTYGGSASKLFRNGISIGPTLSTVRTTDNLVDQLGLNQSTLNFQVVIPLLRGRGRDVVDAQERSSQLNVDASVFDVNNTISQLLTNTAVVYWNVVAAQRQLQIAADSETRGKVLLDDVRTLIAADRQARGEVNQVLANLSERTSSRIAAQEQLQAAEQNLALAMGRRADEVSRMPTPSQPLPDWASDHTPEVTQRATGLFIDRALANRADLRAAKLRQESARVLLPAARDQLRPQLNLKAGPGYSGLIEGTRLDKILYAPFVGVQGLDVVVGLTYNFAPANNTARGLLAQTEAQYRQAVLSQSDVARTIASNVVTGMISFVNSIARYKSAQQAVASYRLALQGERDKFRLGLSSLIDVLTTEDRLTTSLINEVAAQLDYATQLEQLRYATGSILEPDKEVHSIDERVFLTPPFEWVQ